MVQPNAKERDVLEKIKGLRDEVERLEATVARLDSRVVNLEAGAGFDPTANLSVVQDCTFDPGSQERPLDDDDDEGVDAAGPGDTPAEAP